MKSGLILPGGKYEAGESAFECLSREIAEELGSVRIERLQYVGTYEDRAASDDPSVTKTVSIELCRGELIGEPAALAEIAELVWFGPGSDPRLLSPILINKIIPDLAARGIIDWNT